MAKILLTGASGQVSTATIAALKSTGHQLIGLVRDRVKGERLGLEFRLGELAASGLRYTILQPHFFWQNLLFSAPTIAREGAIYWALGEAALPGIDAEDVAAVTARILADPGPHAGKTYTLTGGEAITMHQVAAAIGSAVGKPVRYVPITLETMVEGLSRIGVGDYVEVAYRDYLTLYSQGWRSQVIDAVKRILERPPRSIGDFARRHAGTLVSSARA